MKSKYYRPAWTCGRYNAEKQVALMYNLIEGMSFFFESFSADVIGALLAAGRNSEISVSKVSEKTNIAPVSLEPFFDELLGAGLLVSELQLAEHVAEYRRRVGMANCERTTTAEETTSDKLPFVKSTAEGAYIQAVGGVINVMFELTYNCSERCIHCYNPGATRNDDEQTTRHKRDELTLDDYKRIIDELCDLGLLKVTLSGGDPFSNPLAWDVIDYLYQKEVATTIFTNGQQLLGKVDKLLAYYPQLVGISIYSGLAEDHDRITRVKGSFEKSLQVARELSAAGVPLHIKCSVMRTNVRSYILAADMAKQLGARGQFDICLTDSLEGDRCVSQNLRLTPEMLEIVLRDDNIPLYVGKEAPNFGAVKHIMDSNACGAGENGFCITPEGNVETCVAFPASFGNLKTQSFAEILNSPEMQWWLLLTLNDYEDCGKHDYCDYCNLCVGNNYVEHGTPLKAAEQNYSMAKVRQSVAQRLMNGTGDFCCGIAYMGY